MVRASSIKPNQALQPDELTAAWNAAMLTTQAAVKSPLSLVRYVSNRVLNLRAIREVARGESTEDPQLLVSYELIISKGKKYYSFWAEVRASETCDLQVDWADELQDLLMEEQLNDSVWRILGLAISESYSGKFVGYPVLLCNDT